MFFACQGFVTFLIFVTFSTCFVVLCGSSFVFFNYMCECFLLILLFCTILPLFFVFLCVNVPCLFCCFAWFFLYLNCVFVHPCSPFVLLLCMVLLFFVSMCVDFLNIFCYFAWFLFFSLYICVVMFLDCFVVFVVLLMFFMSLCIDVFAFLVLHGSFSIFYIFMC